MFTPIHSKGRGATRVVGKAFVLWKVDGWVGGRLKKRGDKKKMEAGRGRGWGHIHY